PSKRHVYGDKAIHRLSSIVISNEARNLVWRRKICYVDPNDEMAMSKGFSVASAPSKRNVYGNKAIHRLSSIVISNEVRNLVWW
ncbi:MAG TPA: hypothetical protein G4N95_07860, partial [Anaerolineae bacterium]|nr:hypothetical protein [Anaerolineae bacterium]